MRISSHLFKITALTEMSITEKALFCVFDNANVQ